MLDQRADREVDPALDSTGLPPAAMAVMPCRTIAWASTVAVVVPSPTVSLVLTAASLTSWAPMFSKGSRRWISRAIVTPSLVTSGDPVIFSRMTLRPLGPSVLFTASASWSTPACSRRRPSSPNLSSFAIEPSWKSTESAARVRINEKRATAPRMTGSGGPPTYSISSIAFLATSGGSMSPMYAAASSMLPNITVRSSMWIIFP